MTMDRPWTSSRTSQEWCCLSQLVRSPCLFLSLCAIGTSPNLAVASILLTGVYGASLGGSLLEALGIDPEQSATRGVSIGTSAHAIGTASLMAKEPKVCPSPLSRHLPIPYAAAF